MRGLGKLVKRRMTMETIIGAKADIVCVTETICYINERKWVEGNGRDRQEFNSVTNQAEPIDQPITDRSFT